MNLKIPDSTELFGSNRPLWLAVVGLAAGTACWAAHRSSESKAGSYLSSSLLLRQMHRDAERIRELREVPRIATDRVRPNDELIRQVQQSLKAAGINLESWIGNEPSSAVRVPGTPYKKLGVRLLFEKVTVRQLVLFSHDLTRNDSTLSLAQVRFSAPATRTEEIWDVDLMISYLLYDPHKAEQP